MKQLRSPSGLFPIVSSNGTPTPKPTITPRTLANLAPGWVVQTNNQIPLGNNQSLPPKSFLEVIDTKPNPKPASGDFSVLIRVCTNKPGLKPEKTVSIQFKQLKRFGISVLPSDAPNPCQTV